MFVLTGVCAECLKPRKGDLIWKPLDSCPTQPWWRSGFADCAGVIRVDMRRVQKTLGGISFRRPLTRRAARDVMQFGHTAEEIGGWLEETDEMRDDLGGVLSLSDRVTAQQGQDHMEHTDWSILRSHTCVSGLLGAFIPQTKTGTLRSLIQQSTTTSNRHPLVKDRHTYLHTSFRASREILNMQLSFRASREILGEFKIRSEHRDGF